LNLEKKGSEIKNMQAKGEKFFWLDVRLPQEKKIADLGGDLIPVHILEQNHQSLPKNIPIICYCHHGVRSLAAAEILRSKGFEAYSLAGGIDQWSLDIDPKITRY
jgi:rhodanese-related sulfurtransferase